MFDRPTTFILGAGASVEYGYPTGDDLVGSVIGMSRMLAGYCERSTEATPITSVNPYLPAFIQKPVAQASNEYRKSWSAAAEHFRDLATRLSHINPPLIDHFLDLHPDMRDFGKVAVAAAILQKDANQLRMLEEIRSGRTERREKDWYRYVQDCLTRDCSDLESLHKNRVSFITFNYDVSLEHELFTRISQIRSLTDHAGLAHFLKQRVLHIFGSVRDDFGFGAAMHEPSVMAMKVGNPGDINGWRNNCGEILDAISLAAERLRTIAPIEKHQNQHDILRARTIINEAENVYFVGYGFHEMNNEILDLRETLRIHPRLRVNKALYLMNYKDSPAIRRRTTELFSTAAKNDPTSGLGTYLAAESDVGADETFKTKFALA